MAGEEIAEDAVGFAEGLREMFGKYKVFGGGEISPPPNVSYNAEGY